MPKFMQSLGIETYHRLVTEAKARDVTVQSLIRTVIVPEWLNTAPAVKPSIQTTIARPIAQPGTFISHAGILTETTRRPFLNSTIGRGKPHADPSSTPRSGGGNPSPNRFLSTRKKPR